jgi:hypothetical protein
MKLSTEDIQFILQDFPKFELSYETIVHKKVHDSDILLAIPDGIKSFAWFTTYKNENVCFIMEIDNKHISNVYSVICGFNDILSYGTIFYGNLFTYNNSRCFCIEDLYYYKGKDVSKITYFNKLEHIKYIFTNHISQCALNHQFIIFGLPLIMNHFTYLLREIEALPYKIKYIKFRSSKNFNEKSVYVMNYYKPGSKDKNHNDTNLRQGIFKITPAIQNDIYNLFIYKNGKEDFFDIALIPDYKTSVMMNKLFRNIKENSNLDALEESDDDEEFENEREDKFVYLERSYKMLCNYNNKFKKWVPIALANKNDRLITSNILAIKN